MSYLNQVNNLAPFCVSMKLAFDLYAACVDSPVKSDGDDQPQAQPFDLSKKEYEEFLDKMGVRKDLRVINHPSSKGETRGSNSFHNLAEIFMAQGLVEVDKDAYSWVLKHEIAHIKNNDDFTIPLVAAISALGAAALGIYALPFVPFQFSSAAYVLCQTAFYAIHRKLNPMSALAVIGFVMLTKSSFPATHIAACTSDCVFHLFQTWREARADDFAIEHSSNNELLGGRRFLKADQKYAIDERKKSFFNKIRISSYGDVRVIDPHPSGTSRIQKIEQALEKNGVTFNTREEDEKIDKLHHFIKKLLEPKAPATEENAGRQARSTQGVKTARPVTSRRVYNLRKPSKTTG